MAEEQDTKISRVQLYNEIWEIVVAGIVERNNKILICQYVKIGSSYIA